MSSRKLFALISFSAAALFLIVSCASSPQLYPNEKYEQVGKAGAQADIEDCTKKADDYMTNGKGKQIAKSAGAGAVVGSVAGAALGLFTGNVARGAVEGGVVGGAAGGAHGALSPDEVKHNFINHCLARKGYEVIGWD